MSDMSDAPAATCSRCGDHVGTPRTTYVRVGQAHHWVCAECRDVVLAEVNGER